MKTPHQLTLLLVFILFASCKEQKVEAKNETAYYDSLFVNIARKYRLEDPTITIKKLDSIIPILYEKNFDVVLMKAMTVKANAQYNNTDRNVLKNDLILIEKVHNRSKDSLVYGLYNYVKGYDQLFLKKNLNAAYPYLLESATYTKNRDNVAYSNILSMLIEVAVESSDYHTAIKYLQDMNKLEGHGFKKNNFATSEIYLSISNYYSLLNEMDSCRLYLTKAEKLKKSLRLPISASDQMVYGNLSFKEGNLLDALGYYNRSLEIQPNFTRALVKKAEVFNQLNQLDSVSAILQRIDLQDNSVFKTKSLDKDILPLKIRTTSGQEQANYIAAYKETMENILSSSKGVITERHLNELKIKENENAYQLKISKERNQKILYLILFIVALLIALNIIFFLLNHRHKLNAKNHELQANLAKKRLRVVFEERQRISQELHDDLGANFTLIHLASNLLKEKHPTAHYRELDIILENQGKIYDKIKEIIWSLNTQNDTLGSYILYSKKFAEKFLEPTSIQLNFDDSTQTYHDTFMNSTVRRRMYLIVKELINNTVKHAEATIITIKFYCKSNCFHMDYRDNGRGFDQNQSHKGNGVINIREHVRIMEDSHFEFESNEEGTHYTVILKLN